MTLMESQTFHSGVLVVVKGHSCNGRRPILRTPKASPGGYDHLEIPVLEPLVVRVLLNAVAGMIHLCRGV